MLLYKLPNNANQGLKFINFLELHHFKMLII
jgi:hypothetical protein